MISSKSISSLESTRLSFYPSIYLLTSQSGANYNFGRKASTALPHIYWVLNLSRQYLGITGFLETTLSHISWVSDWLGTESVTKRQVLTAWNTFSESYSIQKQNVFQKDKYQQLYYRLFESSRNWGQILMHENNY